MAFINLKDLEKDHIVDIQVYRDGVEISIGTAKEFARGDDSVVVKICEELDDKNRIIGKQIILYGKVADKYNLKQVFEPPIPIPLEED